MKIEEFNKGSKSESWNWSNAGHSWRSKDELISEDLWTSTDIRASMGRPTITYLYQLCVDIGYTLEELPKEMDDKEGERDRVKEIHAGKRDLIMIYIIQNVNFDS